jgi:HEAT repeat protein
MIGDGSSVPGSPGAPDLEALRRRRDVALAGFDGSGTRARDGLTDPSARVRCAALGALARMGALDDAALDDALGDPSADVRTQAAELSAGHPGVDLCGALSDTDAGVVEAAAWACGERPAPGDRLVARLCELTTGHPEAQCRETAVAALGAIGDGAGLPAILSATRDKATVRRRAVLALASFSGAQVDEALERAAGDRDWQVRQAAEDLR